MTINESGMVLVSEAKIQELMATILKERQEALRLANELALLKGDMEKYRAARDESEQNTTRVRKMLLDANGEIAELKADIERYKLREQLR